MELIAAALTCVRGGREVFADLDFRLSGGQALMLVGPNGAGKSSLLRCVAGLVRPAGGTLVLDGGDPEATIGEQAHYLGHQDALKPALTVRENLDVWAAYLGGSRGAAVDSDDALAALGLDDLADLPAAYLSAGQRRRLSLARLVAVKRPLWLLDEPTAALDAASQTRLVALMTAHLADGGLILAATHGPLGLTGAPELRLGEVA